MFSKGETESQVLALAAENKHIQACIAKPGFITGRGGILRGIMGTAISWTGAVDTIDVKEVAAAMLYETVRGFEDEILTNKVMVKSGREALKEMAKN